ncbi:hypothetical protein T484DRAFT_1904538, partial [Baffinella frigidus]
GRARPCRRSRRPGTARRCRRSPRRARARPSPPSSRRPQVKIPSAPQLLINGGLRGAVVSVGYTLNLPRKASSPGTLC